MKPWLYNGGVVNDGETFSSALKQAGGLPELQARLVRRLGRWPKVAGLDREGRRVFLETMVECISDRRTARQHLLQFLNPELEAAVRLTAADAVWPGAAPDHLLLAAGPWDVYYDWDAAVWYVRDLVSQRLGTLTGGWRTSPGEGLQIAEATTNLILNPSFEVNVTDEWTFYAGDSADGTRTHYTADSRYGDACCQLTECTGNGIYLLATRGVTLGNAYVLSFYARDIDTHSTPFFRVWDVGDGSWLVPSQSMTGISIDGWTRFQAVFTPISNSISIYFEVVGSAVQGSFLLDAVQLEQKAFPTPYCDGSLGAGHSWTGTVHDSTSSRTAAELNFDADAAELVAAQGSLLGWVQAGPGGIDRCLGEFYENASRHIRVLWRSDNKLDVYLNGGYRITNVGSGSTPTWGTWYFACVTWDFGAGAFAAYVYEPSGTLYSGTASGTYAVPTAAYASLGSTYAGGAQCNGWLDGYGILDVALTSSQVAAVYAAGRDRRCRWLDCICESARPMEIGGAPSDWGLVSQLAVDGDVRWRSRDGDMHIWKVLDADEDTAVEVTSDDDVYPTLYIKPTTAKAAGDHWLYKRWIPVVWKATEGYDNYPILIGPIDTTGLVGGGKMQADGDDWRVYVDGAETPRAFGAASGAAGGPNSATTKTWVTLNWEPAQSATLAAAMGAGDTVTYFDVAENISGFPAAGMVLIDSETFVYTGKNDALKRFTGVTRAAKGSTAGAHTLGDTVYWIQHEIWIYYGNSSATAPSYGDWYEPAFEVDSSDNDSWDYEEFGHETELMAVPWVKQLLTEANRYCYQADHRSLSTTTWDEIGCFASYANGIKGSCRWYLFNPCGITNANFQTGETQVGGDIAIFVAFIESSVNGTSWIEEYDVTDAGVPTVINTWENWARNEALTAGAKYVGLRVGPIDSAPHLYSADVEASQVTLTLNTTYSPDHTVGSEQNNYDLDCTIANGTTGESIELAYRMLLNGTLEVDTDAKTVIDCADGSSQLQALTLVGGPRRDWLKMQPGENELNFADALTAGVEVILLWDRRYFE